MKSAKNLLKYSKQNEYYFANSVVRMLLGAAIWFSPMTPFVTCTIVLECALATFMHEIDFGMLERNETKYFPMRTITKK